MNRITKLRLGWKYRKLLRHRKAILAGAACAAIVTAIVIVAARTSRTDAA